VDSIGAWKIRGRQLGEAIGADIIPNATIETQEKYDRVIHVKRYGEVLKRNSIIDTVDAWPQPAGNSWTRDQAIQWGSHYIKPFRVSIAATGKMREDLGATWNLRHHYRPDCQPNQLNAMVKSVGYEGSPRYIEAWLPEILAQCKKRGWSFLLNPTNLSHCDAVLAVRGGEWRGYTTDHWKSNVKLANAIGYGIPMVGLVEAGYAETEVPFIQVCQPVDLSAAFDQLTLSKRYSIAEDYEKIRSYYSIGAVAAEYIEWLHNLKF
jgi:hypothetical protein